jgi:hypothetical protein
MSPRTLIRYSVLGSDYLADLLGDQDVGIKAVEMGAKLQ